MFLLKKFFKFKPRPLIWALFILAVSVGLFFLVKFYHQPPVPARAGINHKVYGWAWSDTIGWVSFNSTNCDANDDGLSDGAPPDCPAAGSPIPDYGVDVDTSCVPVVDSYCSFNDDPVNNSPYAWSNHLGWIDFTPEPDYGLYPGCGYPSDPCHGARIDITELYTNPNKNVYGWAKINTLGDQGWLKLRKGPTDSGPDYGVYIKEDAEFMGWAWNANDDGSGIGWVSFNCENQGSCGSVDYYVRGPVPPVPQNLTVTRTPGWTCSNLTLDWDPTDSALGYEVFRRLPPSGFVKIVPQPGEPYLTSDNYTDSGLAYGTTYYYRVTACNIFGCSNPSIEVAETTNSVCIVSNQPSQLYAVGECPNTVHLYWDKPLATNIDYFIVKRCNETNDDCTTNDNFYSEVPSGSGCYRSYDCDAGNKCRCADDSIAVGDEATYIYRYIISGVNTLPDPDDYGDWSEPSGEVQACPDAPSWREVKP